MYPLSLVILAAAFFGVFGFGMGIVFCGWLINKFPEQNGFVKLRGRERVR